MAPYFGLKGGWLTFWLTVACATDMTLFGYDQGVFGGVVVTQDFLDTLNISGDAKIIGTVTAIYNIGCFLGALSTLFFADRLGRKKSILVGTTIMSIGAILQTATFNLPTMFVGRIVSGIGNGINTSTAPNWQGETAPAKWRGKLIVLEMITNIFGFSLSNWVTFGLSFAPGSISWRFPLAFQFVFIFILYATVPWLPESPRWLIAKGRIEEANVIIADIENLTVDDSYVKAQSHEIEWAVNFERENSVSWSDLFRGRTGDKGGTATVRRLILGMTAQAFQQFSGINITSYYFPTVLIESVGLSNTLARLLAAVNSVQYLFFSLIGIPQVERWGRRKMLIYAALGQGACYLIITICIRYSDYGAVIGEATAKRWGTASIAFFFAYYVFFGIGFQGVPWLYPAEINSLSMRTKGTALSTATNWIFNFVVVEITPIGIQNLGWRFYIIWTIFNFTMAGVVYVFFPETAGRTLEDIDHFFKENPSVLVFKDKEAMSARPPQRFIDRHQRALEESTIEGHGTDKMMEKDSAQVQQAEYS